MIRAVLFDFYDTLGYLDGAPVFAVRRGLAQRAGVDDERFLDVWRATFRERSLGAMGTLEEELSAIFAQLGVALPDIEAAQLAALERRTWCAAVRLYPDVVSTLERLRSGGLKTGLVSNASDQAAAAIRATGLADLLDVLVISCEVRVMKPDPAIYWHACDALGVGPADCAFVGDGGSGELDAAHRLGMRVVRIEHPNHRGDHAENQLYQHHVTAVAQVLDALRAPT